MLFSQKYVLFLIGSLLSVLQTNKKITQVSVVMHCAATINLHETLQVAMKYNVEGTRELLRLAKRLKNIEAFVHISTMYCVATSDRTELDEIIYPAPTTADRVYKALEKNKDPPSDVLCGFINTYTLTKLLAEHAVAEERDSLPIIILRPSMVGNCFHEPVRGYTDTVNLHSYMIYMIARRQVRVMCAKPTNLLDVIPADYVANMILVAAARCPRSNKLTVYNCASSSCNPLSLEQVADLGSKYLEQTENEPLPRKTIMINSKLLSMVIRFIIHIIPTYFMYAWTKISGRNQRWLRSRMFLLRMFAQNEFFYRNSWVMKADGARSLHRSLSDADKRTFYCDPVDFSWREYMPLYIKGIRDSYNAKSKVKK